MGLHIWNLSALGDRKKKKEKKKIINPWWEKSSESSDFHQNGFAREKDIVESASGLKAGKTDLVMRGRAKGFGRKKAKYGIQFQ